MPSGVLSREEEKGSKFPKMIKTASTGLRRSVRLDNKTKQRYVLLDKFSILVIGACEVAKNPHIFLTREN